MSRRQRVEHTEEWTLIEPLLPWHEQREYELLRPIVLFGDTPAERARQTGAAARTLHEKARRFDEEGVPSLFPTVRGPTLRPEIRRLIVDLKVQHPPLSLGEIATICYVQFGRKPSKNTVKAVLREEPAPLFAKRHFPPYHQMPGGRERRTAVVRLHAEGWTPTAIASYLKTTRQTVYSVLRRWIEEGESGLSDKLLGRPKGVSKVDLRAMREVRKLQENPELGEFRIHAALARMGIDLSPRTCGRILAVNRKLYGLKKPKRGAKEKKEMPFQSARRHEIWSVDIRYIDHHLPEGELPEGGGKVYAISILENHSRAILASAITTTQDTTAYLSVLYTAIERYGSPEILVSDGGGVFKASHSKAVYRSLGITKQEIERRRPWQNFIETTFNIQRRMADYYFARAESWEELVAAHDGWVESYNTQKHWAHRERKDARRSPAEVLGFLTGIRHRPEDLRRAFFSTRFTRVLDASGYARLKHWRIYAEEGLARSEVALWLGAESLSVEFAGETLARYDADYSARSNRLREVGRPRLFETIHRRTSAQPRLFELVVLGDTGWLKALRKEEYAPRKPRRPQALQQVLFSYIEAV
ncbi:MAG: helix-turn-helix domain-containing protein [Rubrobacteraceae bacterium]|jgi:transposase